MNEIHKINRALTVLVATLFSDGLLVMLLLSGIIYCRPQIGLVNALYILSVCLVTLNQRQRLSIEISTASSAYNDAERLLAGEIGPQILSARQHTGPEALRRYGMLFTRYIKSIQKLALRANKISLLNECIGTLNVIIVFAFQFLAFFDQDRTFSEVLITIFFSYMITSLMPKICAALLTVSEGTASLQQFKFYISAII